MEVAPGSWWSCCARPGSSRVPCARGAGSLPSSLPRRRSRRAQTADRDRTPASSAATAGSSASTIVLSPAAPCRAPGRPRGPCARPRRSPQVDVRLRRPARAHLQEQRAVERARRAAHARDQRHRDRLQYGAGVVCPAVSSFSIALRIPRSMLVPWSPSPIAVSSSPAPRGAPPSKRRSGSSSRAPCRGGVPAPPRRPSAGRGCAPARPRADHLVVELEQRDRAALHLQRRDVVADQRALDLDARARRASWRPRRTSTYSSISGVPPMPLTNASTWSPEANGRSSRIGVIRRSAICEAGPIFSRKRPGSPWMPMPISISSSASSKLGSPAAGVMHGVSAMPIERPLALTLAARSATSCERVAVLGRAPADLLDEHRDARRRGGRRCRASPAPRRRRW